MKTSTAIKTKMASVAKKIQTVMLAINLGKHMKTSRAMKTNVALVARTDTNNNVGAKRLLTPRAVLANA